MLSNQFKALNGTPEYYRDEYNSFTVTNYWCIFAYLLDALPISSICEIGSDRGDMSTQLIREMKSRSYDLHIVDPVAKEGLDEFAGQNIHIHRETSLSFLEREGRCDLYLIDGDHNYWTVSREIQSILNRRGADTPLILMMHDTSWPCARRDSYYAVGNSVEMKPHRFNSGLHLRDEALNNGRSFPCGDVFAWGEEYGGIRNGVLTAVEDSELIDRDKWWSVSIPSFYGLSIFVEVKPLTPTQVDKLQILHDAIELLKPLLAIHEANRLRLLQGLTETQGHRDKLLGKISRLTGGNE